MADATCSIDDCDRSAFARGWCAKHYSRWLRNGDPMARRHPDAGQRAMEWLTARVEPMISVGTYPAECVADWPFSHRQSGRPQITAVDRRGTRNVAAVVCEMRFGPAPEGQVARHGPCHNVACFNPGHVSWGTQSENLGADKYRDGTMPLGQERHGAKLTDADVIAIRAGTLNDTQWGRRLGVSSVAVRNARIGKTWIHLPAARPGSTERNPGSSKLTEEDVRAIRIGGRTDADWAAEIGVSTGTVQMARSGKTWAHLDAGCPPISAHRPAQRANTARSLTEAQVISIRGGDLSDMEWSRQLSVSVSVVRHARTGQTWAYLPGAVTEGGRNAGERHSHAKLTDDDVRVIRFGTESSRILQARFGVSQGAISMIRRGKTWRHITQDDPATA